MSSEQPDQSILGIFGHHWLIELAAVVTFVASYELFIKSTFIFLKNKWISRKYNISGDYVAYFEDVAGQERMRRYSRLKLTQRGMKIYGRNELSVPEENTKRIWELAGKIFRGHLIAGTYEELSHRDSRSVGAFFVYQKDGTMDFDGYWAGWDEANHKIATGRYEFKKCAKKLRVGVATPEDRHRIAFLSQKAFGHNYFENGIEDKFNLYKETSKLLTAKIKSRENQIHGFALCYMLPVEGLKKFLNIEDHEDNPIDTDMVSRNMPDDLIEADKIGKIGVIQTVCVSSEQRSRGLGQDLFRHAEAHLYEFSPAIMLAPAWNISGHMSAASLLKGYGYDQSISVPHYWKKDCDAKKFSCPSRSSGCICEMTLFKKTL